MAWGGREGGGRERGGDQGGAKDESERVSRLTSEEGRGEGGHDAPQDCGMAWPLLSSPQ